MRLPTEPVTIDDLVADAAVAGHQVSVRLIRDWTERGLLDYPQHRPAGKGHGSKPALYSGNQRSLFLTLLGKRREAGSIRSLARIPVFTWMYFGDEHVPLHQARRAFMTWLGDARTSRQRAKTSAQALLMQLDHPGASTRARRELLAQLTEVAYTGTTNLSQLEHAVRAVFEPGGSPIRRAVGHPSAALTANSAVHLIRARLTAYRLLAAEAIPDELFVEARQEHLMHLGRYQLEQPMLATGSPADRPQMYEVLSTSDLFNSCCDHLLTTIGLKLAQGSD
ncbi:hypothetical protein [Amycolatopsis sp. WQ 127309]|uniref:hypothetical protein n=1 Tax=Amycolatopsis sp. WQ 127309 TaxID=2932773 RepID=UPI001FF20557|nr:hypothetical protein [Amycolatopsis sp. WQ 127309]UOZ07907.1 hypothetical protein MUY22_06375 [Amycolatopsis sp. WQ 127309]